MVLGGQTWFDCWIGLCGFRLILAFWVAAFWGGLGVCGCLVVLSVGFRCFLIS